MVDDYLKNLIQQASDSYDLLNNLKDKPGDIEIIKRELAKIRGLVQVVINKIEKSGNISDSYVELLNMSRAYLEDYDFTRPIEPIEDVSGLYSQDPLRIKNMRLSIILSLEESQLIFKIQSILRE